MARKEARITTAVWRNPSITSLPLAAQGLYWMLLAQPDVSMCGVLPYLPSRWRALCGSDDVEETLTVLEASGAVVVDRDTLEVLIRTFVRHDGVVRSPKTRQPMWKAWEGVLSDRIRAVVLDQVADYVSEAVREGWTTTESIETARQNGVSDTPSDTPSHTPFHPVRNPLPDTPSDTPSHRVGTPATATAVLQEEEGAHPRVDQLAAHVDEQTWTSIVASMPQLETALTAVHKRGWPDQLAVSALTSRLDSAESPAAVILHRARTLASTDPPSRPADAAGCSHCRGTGVTWTDDGREAVRCVHPDLHAGAQA